MSSVPAIKYPILTIKGRSVSFEASLDKLTQCSPKALGDGYYIGLILISIDGTKYVVRIAKKVGHLKPWWTKPIFITRIRVELVIERDGSVTLPKIKQMLCAAYKADPAFWDSAWGEYSEFVAALENCHSFEEMAKLFP